MEARADAAAEMAAFEKGPLEDEFAALETKDNVEDDLAALKAKVGGSCKKQVQVPIHRGFSARYIGIPLPFRASRASGLAERAEYE